MYNENIGEILYTKIRSAYDAVVDCVGYLLYLKWLRSIGQTQTPYKYKERLADIAAGLTPAVAYDDVIHMRIHKPPGSPKSTLSGILCEGRDFTTARAA